MQQMTVRKMGFEFDQNTPITFINDDPGTSYVFVGTWMLLPYLEPYLMKSMRLALPMVNDPELAKDLETFCAQEGQHYQQHARANDVIRTMKPGFAKLKAIEDEIAAEYKGFLANKSLRFNLAYAEGFEGMTAASSRAQMESGFFDHMTGPLKDLMLWHIMEELEHRTVAFEVYEHVYGGYFYRLFVGLWAQWHFLSRGLRLARCMAAADPESFALAANSKSRKARNARNLKLLVCAWPKIMSIYMPWYNPRKVKLPALFYQAQEQYSQLALSTK